MNFHLCFDFKVPRVVAEDGWRECVSVSGVILRQDLLFRGGDGDRNHLLQYDAVEPGRNQLLQDESYRDAHSHFVSLAPFSHMQGGGLLLRVDTSLFVV